MRLAKQHLDVGLFTNNLGPMLAFWQQTVGLPFEEVLPTGGGNHQHRHGLNGAVLKLNHVREPLPESAPSGYHELLIAREGIETPRALTDPDGNRVTLVPPGHREVTSTAVVIRVGDLAAARAHYGGALALDAAGTNAFRCGETLVFLEEDRGRAPAGDMRARGYRYLTVQVWDADAEYAGIVARGGTGATPPRTLGKVARFGFVRDPGGNWLEISQRASLTGPLPED